MILIGMLLGLINRYAKQPESFPATTSSYQRLLNGPYEVEKIQRTFVDLSRPTQSNHDYPGEDRRVLKTNIWFPSDSGSNKHPLIIYAHGFSSNHNAAKITNAHLASHGYIVMAPNFPLTNTLAPGGPLAIDVANQAGDVSYVIDQAIKLSNSTDGVLSGKLDATRIGAIGISMGGLTSSVAAFHPTDRDSRIGAAVSIAGPLNFFDSRFFAARKLPFLMIGGDLDVIVPYASNARPALDRVPGATLVTVAGGSHLGFADIAAPLRWLKNPDVIGCYFVEKNLADEQPDDPRWQNLFGPSDLGINYDSPESPCTHDSLPNAINVLQQTAVTRLAVRAFLDSIFLPNIEARNKASDYLMTILPNEVSEIRVEKNLTEIHEATF